MGQRVTEVFLLHSENTTQEWGIKEGHEQQKNSEKPEVAKASKMSTNIALNTSIGMNQDQHNTSIANTTLNSSFLDSSKLQWDQDTMPENTGNDAPSNEPKTIYNNAVDAMASTGNFNNKNITLVNSGKQPSNQPIIGIFCIRWRRNGEKQENESKFVVNTIEIVEAPLNLYCYLDEKMYVKVPMTLTIFLKNSTKRTIHLKSYLKNADSFMCAGHSQVCRILRCFLEFLNNTRINFFIAIYISS